MSQGNVFGKRVKMPTFQVFTSPQVRVSEVKQRRFNIIDRMTIRKYMVCG